MKKTLLIGLAFFLGAWAAAFIEKAPPQAEGGRRSVSISTPRPADHRSPPDHEEDQDDRDHKG